MKKLALVLCAILALATESVTKISDLNKSEILGTDLNASEQNATLQNEQTASTAEFAQEIQKMQEPPKQPENFTSQLFSLPSNALIIDTIVVRYTDADGAMQERVIDINRSIDWHDDFLLSARAKPSLSKILDVSVTSNDPNLRNGEQIDTLQPGFAPKLDLPLETIKFDDKLQFVIRNGNMQLVTNDELNFVDTNTTNQILLKLARDEMKLSKVGFVVNVGGFRNINISRNSGFYDLNVSADSNISAQKISNGYLLQIK